MINKPVKGMKVVITDQWCCSGHKKGVTGVIARIDGDDLFSVKADNPGWGPKSLWHCHKCVSELAAKAEKEAQG